MQAIEVNYMAVLVCGIASMVLGSLWYGPLFGKTWTKMIGWDKMSAAQMDAAKKGMMKSYVMTLIGSLVMAYVLAHSLVFASAYTNTTGIAAGLMVGFWSWVGFVAPFTMNDVLWGQKSWPLWLLNNGYNLIQLMLFGVILSLWK